MVNQKIRVRDKYRTVKKIIKVLLILALITLILLLVFFGGLFSSEKKELVLINPLTDIVFANTDADGKVNKEAVIEQGVLKFNGDYINYILVALGVNHLHKSLIGYGNPVIELNLGDESWNSEIIKGTLNTDKGAIDEEDLRITISKEEAVLALLSTDIRTFMKTSVYNGNTRIEMIAGKIELGSKGYLKMYTELTGEEIEIDDEEMEVE